jgi:hypothetical protein
VWGTLGAALRNKHNSASFLLGGCLHVAGWGDDSSSSVERYDVATNTWTAMADMLTSRVHFCAVTMGSADPAEDQDLFDTLIAKAIRERV